MHIRIPFPRRKSKRSKALVSLNNLNQINPFELSRIKEDFKRELVEWYIPKKKNPAPGLLIRAKLLRKGKRKFDAINAAIAVKWIEDVLEEQGWVDDDTTDHIEILPTVGGSDVEETMIEITIKVLHDKP